MRSGVVLTAPCGRRGADGGMLNAATGKVRWGVDASGDVGLIFFRPCGICFGFWDDGQP